jgi:amino acid adenylation domain-containing protein/non-ribosomal peptide synthase protein (TIGR01720 family)
MKNVEDVYPLSPMQQGMLFHSLYSPRSEVYIDQASCLLQGEINVAGFQHAWRQVVERHAVLRTAFLYQGLDEPLQIVRQHVTLPWEEQDWRNLTSSEQKAELETYLQADRERGFDLTRAPLMRWAMLHMGEREWQFVWSFHHLLLDGWCTTLLLKEFFSYYEAYSRGKQLELARPRPYRDYIGWLQGQDMREAEAYWRSRLAGFTSPTPLGIGAQATALHLSTSTYAEQQIYLAAETTCELEALARQQQVTLNTVVQGAWALLLSRYSQEQDVLFGATVSGRPPQLAGVEEMVGLFINSLPVRVLVREEARLGEWLQQLQAEQSEMRQYEYSPLVEVQGWSEVERGVALFESLLAYENYPVEQVMGSVDGEENAAGKLNVSQGRSLERTNYPLTLVVGPGSRLLIRVMYDAQRFEAVAIERLLGHIEQLLESIAEGAAQQLSELRLLTREEEAQLVVGWNNTESEYPRDLCIHQLFERQAALTPEAIAVVYEDEQLTYRELNRRSNQLAHHLGSLGVGPESLVGICLDRSLEMIVGLLAILKTGAAYLPLDPEYPEERLSFMLQDAQIGVLLTQQAFKESFTESGARFVCTDVDGPIIERESEENPFHESAGSSTAYVIYTSGSTGEPKGILVPHRAVIRLIYQTNYIRLNPSDRVAQASNASFDAATFEIWGALIHGAQLVIITKDVTLSPTAFSTHIRSQGITTLFLTTALFNLLAHEAPDAFGSIRHLLFGGEAVDPGCVRKILQSARPERLLHVYGPTECTTFATYHVIEGVHESATTIPIGRPIANTTAYILGHNLEPVPVGVPGELHLGGDGLAQGYLHRPGLTADKFIPHPYSEQGGERLYKTGDWARYQTDGSIEFVGRMDNQVKVRGHRIELGEIEAVLCRYPALRECVVLFREEREGDKRLSCYVVMEDGASVSTEELREYLRERLPTYMIPSLFIELAEMPLNANGKVDRGALPAPDEAKGENIEKYAAPRTPVEGILAGIWADVLGVERVGIHDNFFELGGHSLLATQIISRVRESFQLELPLRSLFEAFTISSFAERVDVALRTQQQVQAPPLVPVSREQPLPLSFAQQRLWFLDQLDPFTATYNIPSVVRLRGPLQFSVLSRAFNEIVRRHEALRTCFVTEQGRASQIIFDPELLDIPLIDVTNHPAAEQAHEIKRLSALEARQPFDLSTGPLLRVRLLRLSPLHHLLLMTMHHIISDGWSMSVLIRELVLLYDAFQYAKPSPLPPLALQYADYAAWQRQWLQGSALAAHLSYWREQLFGAPPVLELPTDRPRPAVQGFAGATLTRRMPEGLLGQLESVSRREGMTLYMSLLAGFKVVLARYTGQEEVVVGTPIAGRTRSEVEGLIGFFVNTLVLRTKVGEGQSVRELMGAVREVCLGGYTHQEVPFEQLVEEMEVERDLSHQPLFQVMFELEGGGKKEGWRVGEMEVRFEESESEVAKFDLTLRVRSGEEGLECGIEYKRELYEEGTIERMLGHVEEVLKGMVKDVRQEVREIELMSEGERVQLLVQWNRTEAEYSRDLCIHQLFEHQAALRPDSIAVVYEDERLTYAELNRRSNQLAHHLQSLGVGPESLVGIYVDRSLEMMVGLLAILKAGGAYLPLDPEYPQERLSFMLEDSSAPVLLTQQSLAHSLSLHHSHLVDLDSAWLSFSDLSELNPAGYVCSGNLAYVIYTSGSTGRPKGVQIEHRAVVNFLSSMLAEPGLCSDDTLLAVTSLSFDIASLELFLPLVCGARMELASREVAADGRRLKELLVRSRASVMQATPATWRLLAAAGWDGLEQVRRWCGGEALSRDLAQQLLADGTEVWNLYGPTETTIWSALWRVAEGSGEVLIGTPIANTQLYVLDERMRVLPIGVAGELLIGGEGLSRGYLNHAAMTAERFIPDPFSQRAGERLYRTGDLARYRADGSIECLGRIDNQVKVRGYRIELEEVEAALTEHQAIRQSVVTVKEDAVGNKRLVAYLVMEPGVEVSSGEFRKALRDKLPEYMIPARYMKLERLPLTPNGKVDRRALPEIDREGLIGRSEYEGPRTAVEEALTNVWATVLGVKQVGIHDNFFELGGDSILSIQIIAQAKEAGFQITPKDLFQHQTIASLAEIIGTAPLIEAEQGLVMGPAELTPSQHWFLAHQSIDTHHFNQSVLLEIIDSAHPLLLRDAARQVLLHHDATRLRFHLGELGWQQFHAPAQQPFHFSLIDLRSLPPHLRPAAITAAASDSQTSLSLATGPLLRFLFFDLGEAEPARLLIVSHHLVVDGVSWRILLEDLQLAYSQLLAGEAVQLAAKTTSFQHWAETLKEYAASPSVLDQSAYWLSAGRQQVCALPRDELRGENQISSTQVVSVALSGEETRALLQEVPAVYHTQVNDLLLTALALALTKWMGSERVLIDMEGHGREQVSPRVDVSRTVGWFTSIYPVLLEVGGHGGGGVREEQVGEELKRVKEQLREIPEQGIGYGLLRYMSGNQQVRAELERMPQAEVIFNYSGQFDQTLKGQELFAMAREDRGEGRSQRSRRWHLLEVSGGVVEGQLQLTWAYSERVHRRETVERVSAEFIEVLQEFIQHCRKAGIVGITPSDFPEAELSQRELDELIAELS